MLWNAVNKISSWCHHQRQCWRWWQHVVWWRSWKIWPSPKWRVSIERESTPFWENPDSFLNDAPPEGSFHSKNQLGPLSRFTIQKKGIRVVYNPTTGVPYIFVLSYANLKSLKHRRTQARELFKKILPVYTASWPNRMMMLFWRDS